jgi:hypothetical protein
MRGRRHVLAPLPRRSPAIAWRSNEFAGLLHAFAQDARGAVFSTIPNGLGGKTHGVVIDASAYPAFILAELVQFAQFASLLLRESPKGS